MMAVGASVIPFSGTASKSRFYVPPTVQSDFVNLLHTDIPNFTYTFELIRDWCDTRKEGYEPVYFRATYYPIDWKSKIGNSDMAENLKTDYSTEIHKGDMIRNMDGEVFLLNWYVQKHINNQTTQAAVCNVNLTVTRELPEELDDNGRVMTRGRAAVIVDAVPALFTMYAGRPDYTKTQDSPGVLSDMLIQGQVQFNEQTKNMRINDEFEWGVSRYRVINLGYNEVEIGGDCGILNIHAKRVAGEQ